MRVMIRKRLRALIGWKDVGAALNAMREHIGRLEYLILAQGKEIEALKYQRLQREAKQHQAFVPSDWETVQAAYAADEKHYKES